MNSNFRIVKEVGNETRSADRNQRVAIGIDGNVSDLWLYMAGSRVAKGRELSMQAMWL
jgi:hypothetical protein